jgi:hypothetical protein
MKAITLYQPWATLVAIGAKRIETRSWSTQYRGPLAIHVSKRVPKEYQKLCGFTAPEPFKSVLEGHLWTAEPCTIGMFGPAMRYSAPREKLHLGCVIATCDLIGVDQFGDWIDRDPVTWLKGKSYFVLSDWERAFGDFSVGRYGWFLDNVKLLPEPIPAKGAQGLWEWNPVLEVA